MQQVVGRNAELCPHPDRREQAAIGLAGKRRAMIVCKLCYDTFGVLISSWHAYSIKPRTVYRRLRWLGYSRLDALSFLGQLVMDRAQVRLGILSRGQLDV